MDGDEKPNLPKAMSTMADDLGLDKNALTNFDLGSVFKQGTNSALFLTRISHVYSENESQEKKIEALEGELKEIRNSLEQAKVKNHALQKSEAELRLRYEHLASTGQHSILSTILFTLGSLAIGVSGSFINAKEIENAIICGVVGLALSVFAASLIIRRSKSTSMGEKK